ncbi:hypothetical protein J6590_028439 [Homalodisca vitripennis]|nr:hypothetical protein J6590_028439 [Homalodisca vitripennis]
MNYKKLAHIPVSCNTLFDRPYRLAVKLFINEFSTMWYAAVLHGYFAVHAMTRSLSIVAAVPPSPSLHLTLHHLNMLALSLSLSLSLLPHLSPSPVLLSACY